MTDRFDMMMSKLQNREDWLEEWEEPTLIETTSGNRVRKRRRQKAHKRGISHNYVNVYYQRGLGFVESIGGTDDPTINRKSQSLKRPKPEKKKIVKPKKTIKKVRIRSWGERMIAKYFRAHDISFRMQHTFPDCMDKTLLRFDVAVFNDDGSLKFLIEYDGYHHEGPVERYGGDSAFENTKRRDMIKERYCIDNGINLIRIKHSDVGGDAEKLAVILDTI